MAKKGKIRMPSAQGGLVRYFDEEYKSRFIFKPEWIIGAVLVVAAAIIGLHLWGVV
tara:strand:+ start:287 stop:454 length:168 start_codon:yes stop_codon:yes gene_type:complete